MTMDDDASSWHLWNLPVSCVAREHLAKHDGLLAEADGTLVVREEVDQFVSEDGGTAWLQHDDGNSSGDLRREFIEDAQQVAARFVEKSEVVERTAAADVLLRNLDAGACGGEELRCGRERLRVEVVIPRIGPEQHGLAA